MKNTGDSTLITPSRPIGFSIFDQNDIRICSWSGPFEALGSLSPGENVTQTWDQTNCYGGGNQTTSGIYDLRADHFYEFTLRTTPVHQFHIAGTEQFTNSSIWIERSTLQYGNEWDETISQRYEDSFPSHNFPLR